MVLYIIGQVDSHGKVHNGIAPLSDLRHTTHCCCSLCSLYFNFPECLGFGYYNMCLCVETTGSCRFHLETPRTLLKHEMTWFCIDLRVAIPCDTEVPCAVGICGLMIYNGGHP